MKSSWGAKPLTTAVAAFCLALPLWLASCAPLQNAYDAGPAPAAAPEPRPAPPVSPPEEAVAPTASGAGLGASGQGASGAGTTGQGATGLGTAGGVSETVPSAGSTPPASGGSNPGGQAAGIPAAGGSGPGGLPSGGFRTGGGAPDTQAQLPGGAGQQPPPASGAAAGPTAGSTATGSTSPGTGAGDAPGSGIAVYYVAIDDGGRSGVRFGCNDSLVAVHNADASITEPLQAAMSRLLSGAGAPPASGLYNALSASSLQYVSGYLDGTTVVVNLTGAVQPGGVCDLPRIEAQLTHTAVTAVGAVRAEIYVSGVPLAEVLGLR
ncbi:GerMN domain-containing protein [Arthrobacter sp. NPDC056727]|uniref:GerMN domain-containing protein n=1 Tax=Arthrobacter sp. NPDC056727 TaxID=3345927 RepID=UPI00366F7AEB